ncbi:MAG: hypothetical protein N2201_01830 [candidate division WOR-3 bacterium]|nr:hypothetical protein [candidate division WOR-3 bacterium]
MAGRVSEEYNMLMGITGVSSKIAAFFLRDIVDFSNIDISEWNLEQLCFLQPIDM